MAYQFVSKDGTPLTNGVLVQVPSKVSELPNGEVVESPNKFSEVKVEGGKWVFTVWNNSTVTIDNKDELVIGVWEFVKDPVVPIEEKTKESPKKVLPQTGEQASVLWLGLILTMVGLGGLQKT